MNARFLSPNPRQRASPELDNLLSQGTDQIAIAGAFLTAGGAQVLKRHAQRLRSADSFVVVAWELPTNLEVLNELYALFPGNLYLHLGDKTPVEKEVGRGLMHSKVYLARRERRCWLWTGSHNLTASAVLGVNCEAAVLMDGTLDEAVFQDAMTHLIRCKSEAIVFDPSNPPPLLSGEQTLIIHAECDVSIKSSPWFVHLRAATTDYDRAMRPPAPVWLYLYSPGTLRLGHLRPPAIAAYSGRLTALNFTEYHPRERGIPADWNNADYVIEQVNGIFHLSQPTPHTRTPTQGVFRVETQQDPTTVWLTRDPSPKLEPIVGEKWLTEIEPEYREFFTRQSLEGPRLVHRKYSDLKLVYKVARKELGSLPETELAERMALPANARFDVREIEEGEDKFAFIYRAKYKA